MSASPRSWRPPAATSWASRTWRACSSPRPRRALIKALKDEVGLPIHFHTHDTSGIAGASVLAAVEAGVDAVDAAMDAMSGLTSQPCLGSIVEALRHTERDTGLDPEAIRQLSFYWEAVRAQYAAFESDLRSGASEVYLHEMPGGQFTNLKEQARALGLETRWHEVARAYRAANDMFGDIVKVTPSSKVVGDMALMMVAQGLTPAEVVDPAREIAFPASVVEMLHGDLGQPPGGWPAALQRKALKGEAPITVRPGSLLPAADLKAEAAEAEKRCGRALDENELAAYLMYPKVFADFASASRKYGPVSVLPTLTYFYGMAVGDEIAVELERARPWSCACRRWARPTRRARSASSSSSTASPASPASPTAPPSPSSPPAARPRTATTPTSPPQCPARSPPSPSAPASR